MLIREKVVTVKRDEHGPRSAYLLNGVVIDVSEHPLRRQFRDGDWVELSYTGNDVKQSPAQSVRWLYTSSAFDVIHRVEKLSHYGDYYMTFKLQHLARETIGNSIPLYYDGVYGDHTLRISVRRSI